MTVIVWICCTWNFRPQLREDMSFMCGRDGRQSDNLGNAEAFELKRIPTDAFSAGSTTSLVYIVASVQEFAVEFDNTTRRLELLTSTVSKARQSATPVFLSTYPPAKALSGMLGNAYCSLVVPTQSA